MPHNHYNPRQVLNKAYLKLKPERVAIDRFKLQLLKLLHLSAQNPDQHEEFHKNLVSEFLKNSYYLADFYINVHDRNDLVIHNGASPKSPIGVIIETKKPSNKSEMVSRDKLNTKALQELLLYYLRERVTGKNENLKYLIATNINEWFVFDAHIFEKAFANNKTLVRQFNDFEAGRLSGNTTDFFYKNIAYPAIEAIKSDLDFTWFNISDHQKSLVSSDKREETKLIPLFKLLSPQHLLKLPFVNDSNTLDKRFYAELLHIIGLGEVKEGGRKVIERKGEEERQAGSLLENTILQLDTLDKIGRLGNPGHFGQTYQERLFNVALELVITWVNRILFLKLLEAQLLRYHKADTTYAFLNGQKIHNYDDLNSLFFQVLARKPEDRSAEVQRLFGNIPYLNSSLFEPTELEHVTLFISQLQDEKQLSAAGGTVLKNKQAKRLKGNLEGLQYLFEFLNAYDFSSEGSEEIQEENKTLINASVLGLIFEKINGYKDGSFFTPGFITMYMCRETIRRAVVQKFNEAAQLLRGAGVVSKKRMIIPYNPKLKDLARKLRNESTKAETIFWKALKGKFEGKYGFHRQKPLDNYIADFYCYELKLVIEMDGASHDWERTQQKDFEKESKLNELGLNVLRFSDDDVLNHLNSILDNIRDYIHGFETSDLSEFKYHDTPLNPYSKAEFVVADNTPLNPFSRGDFERFHTLDDVYDAIGSSPSDIFTRAEANNIINDLKICDPAVGSGHFLVSALNEILSIKSELSILQDREGRRLKEYHLVVENDELIITDEDGLLFEYHPASKESQRVQEAIFHEKQHIIENCLFGVDINQNSVKICRLRLWIELLKNAYYISGINRENSSPVCYLDSAELREGYELSTANQLQTLPNIDINIKCGNSLISRFALDADLKDALKKSKWSIDSYRLAVDTYRNAENKEQKHEMERLIRDIKSDFRSEITGNDPKLKKLARAKGSLTKLTTQTGMFDKTAKEQKIWQKEVDKWTKEIQKLEVEIEEIKNNRIYEDAFEWRFEFPEVLDDDGNFVGFDVVIGNPPYIRQEELTPLKPYLQQQYQTYAGTADLYVYFVERGLSICRSAGEFVYVLPNKWMRAGYGKALRSWIRNYQIRSIIDFGDLPVFEEATTYPCLWFVKKHTSDTHTFEFVQIETLEVKDNLGSYIEKGKQSVDIRLLNDSGWTLVNEKVQRLIEKIKNAGTPLGEYVKGKIFYGIKTGLNEAFVIDEEIKARLIEEDPHSTEIIKPFLAGRDIKRYQSPKSDKYLILLKNGSATGWFGKINEEQAWEKLNKKYPAICNHLLKFKVKANKRYDQGEYWWELRACDYYEEFEKPKIFIPAIVKSANYTFDETGKFGNDKTSIIAVDNLSLLGIINSSAIDFYLKNIASTKQNGYFEYKPVYISQLPIKHDDTEKIGCLSSQILQLKKQNPNADTSKLEQQIDQLVYALYGLTEEEIGIIEGI